MRQDIAGRNTVFHWLLKKKKGCLKNQACSGLAQEEGEVLNKNSNDEHMQSSL